MQLTDYHAKYFAYEITRRFSSDNDEKLAGVLVDAQVDLNPHQVEAALFAFKSPLGRGALLADEPAETVEELISNDYEALAETSEEWLEDLKVMGRSRTLTDR